MLKTIIFYNIAVVVYYMATVFLFDGHEVIFPTFFISLFLFTNFFIKDKKTWGYVILLYLIIIANFFAPRTRESIIIIYLIFTPLTIGAGLYLKNKHWVLKFVYSSLLVLVGLYGISNFHYYYENFNKQKNFLSPSITFLTEENKELRLDTITDKVIILDFWVTTCGVCFQKFPEFEKVYLKYKNNPKVKMYVVNIPPGRYDAIKDDAKNKIEKYKYKFTKLYATSDTIPKQLGFNLYPHLVILKDNKVRFNGTAVYKNKKIIVRTIEDEIEYLLNEE